ISVYLGNVCITENGTRAPTYREERGQAEMNRAEITITVKLSRGKAREVVWTSDLSEEYVRINASYRSGPGSHEGGAGSRRRGAGWQRSGTGGPASCICSPGWPVGVSRWQL